MKKYIFSIIFLVFFAVIFFVPTIPVYAQKKEGSPPALLKKAAVKLGRASILSGKVTNKGSNILTVAKDEKTYTVRTDRKTQLRRKFWGIASYNEIQINDLVNVHGKWMDDAQTSIQAFLVRDLSIQKRNGVFLGTVQSISGETILLQTFNRGTQTVKVTAKTKFIDRTGKTIKQADVTSGHRIRVKGLWDSTSSTITEVTQVKDFSLPVVKPTVTPSSTQAK